MTRRRNHVGRCTSHGPAPITSPTAIDRLAHDAAAVVALLERFGALLTDALDAAGRGADDEFATAVGERARVTAALRPRLATLNAARRALRHAPAAEADRLAAVLRPVDDAVEYARLLHLRVTDAPDDGACVSRPSASAGLTLVR